MYDGSVELGEGETPEARFIKIQAAYELLVDKTERQQYDYDNRVNPLKVQSCLKLYVFFMVDANSSDALRQLLWHQS